MERDFFSAQSLCVAALVLMYPEVTKDAEHPMGLTSNLGLDK